MSGFKPIRTFSANEGDYSVDNAGPDAIERDLDELAAMFDPTAVHSDGSPGGISPENFDFQLDGPDMSSKIGSAPIEGLTAENNVYSQLAAIVNILLTHSNLKDNDTLSYIGGYLDGSPMNSQSIVDRLYALVLDRYTKAATDSLVAERTNPLVKSLSFDSQTGILTATTMAGSTSQVFDLNIEKIPVAVAIVEEQGSTYIRITNTDGTYTQSDVTSLLTQYDFLSTDMITAQVGKTGNRGTVKFGIKAGSITKEMLDAAILSEVNQSETNVVTYAESALQAKADAESSAQAAKTSEKLAEGFAESSEQNAVNAESSASSAIAAADSAKDAEKNSYDYSLLSKSYAKGGTGVRPNEDTDNAKYYMEHAAAYASGDGVSVFIQSDEPSVNNCIWIKPLNESLLTTGTVMLELSDDLNSSNYYAEIDGELKAVENVVDSENELTDDSYMFEII